MNHVYIEKKYNLAVFWTPKCACGAVAEWFSNAVIGNNMSRSQLKKSQYAYNHIDALKEIKKHNLKTVFITRNPYNRAASAFLNKFYLHPVYGEMKSIDDMEPFTKKFCNQINIPDNFDGITFLEYLDGIRKLTTDSPKKPIDRHWDTQYPRNLSLLNNVDYIVKIENLNFDLSLINKKFSLIDFLPKKNNATLYPSHFIKTEDNLDRVKTLSLLNKKIAVSKNNLLTKESKNIISDIYTRDFLLFNYNL